MGEAEAEAAGRRSGMGVTYSSETDGAASETLLRLKERLRLPFDVAQRLVVTYHEHSMLPILDESSVRSLFSIALRPYVVEDPSTRADFLDEVLEAVWIIFSDSATCFAQEILSCIVLLCNAPWNKRLSLMFDIFKCHAIEELYHEDLQLASQVTAQGLLRLWRAPAWPIEDLRSLSESIADHAFLKLEKDLADPVARDAFITWSLDRFREARTVATTDALKQIYTTTFL